MSSKLAKNIKRSIITTHALFFIPVFAFAAQESKPIDDISYAEDAVVIDGTTEENRRTLFVKEKYPDIIVNNDESERKLAFTHYEEAVAEAERIAREKQLEEERRAEEERQRQEEWLARLEEEAISHPEYEDDDIKIDTDDFEEENDTATYLTSDDLINDGEVIVDGVVYRYLSDGAYDLSQYDIPGRSIGNNFIIDENGYIVAASSKYPVGTVIGTPFNQRSAKVYSTISNSSDTSLYLFLR